MPVFLKHWTGGPVPPAAEETISVDITLLTAGTYEGDIIVTAPAAQGSPDTVHVILNIDDQPQLVVAPTQLIFHVPEGETDPQPLTFNISNGGGGEFDFEAFFDAFWLNLAVDSGGPVPPAVNDSVFVVNIAGMASGTYQADITVTAEGAL